MSVIVVLTIMDDGIMFDVTVISNSIAALEWVKKVQDLYPKSTYHVTEMKYVPDGVIKCL